MNLKKECPFLRSLAMPVITACCLLPVWGQAQTPVYASNVVLVKNQSSGVIKMQDVVVSGKVISQQDNLPLPGATVRVKDGTNITTTDLNGNFRISVPDNNATLLVSFIGFTTQEIALNGRSIVNIQLQENNNNLKEVVINVPYGQQTRASYTGSATTVKSETISSRPRPSFQESLQGNVAGVQVSQGSGLPGAEVAVRIRGISSANGSGDPLYVVDGIPVVAGPVSGYAWSSNTLAGINPNDIESVTVLKDASATSIYGSRGANGVILIKTKSGAAGKTKVDFTAQYGVSSLTMTDRNKPLNTQEMTELLTEGVLNNPTYGITTQTAALDFLRARGLNTDVNTDWQDLVTRKGQYQQYGVSVSGGDERTTFNISGAYYKQEAVVKPADYERINARINLTHKASKRLSVNGNLGVNYQDLNTIRGQWWGENPIRNMRLTVPWVSPYNPDGSYNTAVTYNNEILVKENKKNTKIYQLLGNMGAEFKILDQLTAESRVGIDFNYSDEELYWHPQWVDAQAYNGIGGNYSTKFTNWNIVNLLKYQQQFGDFGVQATLGQEAQKINQKVLAAEKFDYAALGLTTLDNAAQMLYIGSALSESSLASYFLNTSFNYKQKYYLNLTARRDGSSRFGPNYQYGNFGSVGVAWNIHDESFFKPVTFINELKLRSSYGYNGNQPGFYVWQGYYGTGANYANSPGYALISLENASLTWEKNKPFDIGLDFAILNSRLTGTVDYYTRTTSDLLFYVPVSFTNGGINASGVSRNIGEFKNSGFELSLNSQNIRPGRPNGFSWTTSFNISTLRNKVTQLSKEGEKIIDGYFLHEVGEDFYQFYMKGWAGVDSQTGEGLWYTDETKTTTTKDYNQAKLFKQGSALPKFFGGLTNTFAYKGVGLSFLIYFNWGNKIYDNYGRFTQSDGAAGTNVYGAMDRVEYTYRWRKPGDVTNVPKIVYAGTQTGLSSQNSTRFMYDGSYVRLRDVTLSYNLPVSKVISNARIYIRGNNLLTYIKDDVLPYDPEGYLGGLNNGQVPVSKQILLGVNLTF